MGVVNRIAAIGVVYRKRVVVIILVEVVGVLYRAGVLFLLHISQVDQTYLGDYGVRNVNVVVLGARLGGTRLFVLCVGEVNTPVVVFVVGVVCSIRAKHGRSTLGALVY